MTNVIETPAAQLLEAWLEGGQLASQYSEPTEVTFIERDRDERRRDFAAGIELVAQGMLAMTRVDAKGEYTYVVPVTDQTYFPRCPDILEPSKMVVMFNRQATQDRAEDSNIFGLRGRLGLKAVTLQAGYSQTNGAPAAQLGLALPYRATNPKDESEEAFTVATVQLNGYTYGETQAPNPSRDGFLKYSLGLVEPDEAIGHWQDIGGLDYVVGLSGATNYLADALPKLGDYFKALAEMLD